MDLWMQEDAPLAARAVRMGLAEQQSGFVFETQHRLIHALELIGAGFVLLDAKGRIVHVNGIAKSMMPLCKDLLRPGLFFLAAADFAIEKGDWEVSPGFAESWVKRAMSFRAKPETVALRGLRWARFEAQRTCEDGLVITMTDVTEYRKREVWLTEMHERLQGEGEDLKVFAKHLATAKGEATEALRRVERANAALANEVSERRALEEELRRIANTDSLTGILNRRRFVELMEGEVDRSRRYGRPLALLMIDIDYFKRINDSFGHSAGDEALRQFAQICRSSLREVDMFGRLGGEEFAALLPETGHEGAIDAAQRLREATRKAEFKFENEAIQITVSIGIATLESSTNTPSIMLSRADKALYAAKQGGRDRVAHVTGDKEPRIDRQRIIDGH